MLKLLFNRKGVIVYSLLVLGLILSVIQVLRLPDQWDKRGFLTSVSYLLFVILGAILSLIRFIPWYSKESRGLGIEEHFEKNMVPVAYGAVIGILLLQVFYSPWIFFVLMNAFFLAALSVNTILIYFHFVDTDQTPPAFFTPDRKNH